MGKGVTWWDGWFCTVTSRGLSAQGKQLSDLLLLKRVPDSQAQGQPGTHKLCMCLWEDKGRKEVGLPGGRSGAQHGSTPGRVWGACSSRGPAFACFGQQLLGGLRDTSYQFFMPIL